MLKLRNVDAAGERALRVVSYFDQLATHVPDLEAVVRATAVIADCPAGISIPASNETIRFTPDGIVLDFASPVLTSSKLTVDSEDDDRPVVWLERPGVASEFDEFILERMALTVASVLQRQRSPHTAPEPTGLSDPALVQLLLAERASETERSRAARLLGLDPTSQVRVIALATDDTAHPPDTLERWLRSSWARPVHVAQLTRELAVAIAVGAHDLPWSEAPYEGHGAIGPVVAASDAPKSWNEARVALRLAGTSTVWPRLITSDEIGSLRLVMDLDPDSVRRNPDIRLIQTIASQNAGLESLRILDHVVHSDSLRSAAREANFHHSSLQSRVARLERCLGFSCRTGAGRDRLSLALLLWRLYASSAEVRELTSDRV